MNSLTSFMRMRWEKSASSSADTASKASKGLKPGDVLVVSTQENKSPGPVDRVFRWGTKAVQGGLTHAAIYVGDNKIVEARIGEGVTTKHIDEALRDKSFVALRPNLAPSTRKNAAEFAKRQVGKDYSNVGLAMAAVGAFLPESAAKAIDTNVSKDQEAWVCANLITAAYAKARLTTLRGILAPADLRTSPKMTHVKTVVADPEHMSDPVLGRLSGVPKVAEVEYRGKTFPGYNHPIKSDSADKKMMVLAKKGDEVKLVHFGQKGYQHNYSPEAKQNYLTRSAGIRNKSGQLTKDDPFSPNYWARKVLWPKGETGHGHNGPVNTEVRVSSEKKASLAAFLEKRAAELSDAARENIPASEFAVSKRLAKKSGDEVRAGEEGKYPIPDRAHARNALARVAQHGTPAEVAAVKAKVKKAFPDIDVGGEKDAAAVPNWLKNPTLIGALTGAGVGATGGALVSEKGKRGRGALAGALGGGLLGGSVGMAAKGLRDRALSDAQPLLNRKLDDLIVHRTMNPMRQRHVGVINDIARREHEHVSRGLGQLKLTPQEQEDLAYANKKLDFLENVYKRRKDGIIREHSAPIHNEAAQNALLAGTGAGLYATGANYLHNQRVRAKEKEQGTKQAGALLSTIIDRKENEKLAAALKLADDTTPTPAKKWSWKGFREGIRDEGIPMAGMVGGAYLGHRLLPGSSGAVYGSGIGYGTGALANLGLEHALHKKQQSKTASDSSPSSFIPGAVGATLGAGIAGGLTKDEKNKGRNMLAGSAIGYGLADASMLAREMIKKRMAK